MGTSTLLTFATPNFYYGKALLVQSASRLNIGRVYTHTWDDFRQTDFYKTHSRITTQSRGAGYWLWKPYYIHELLKLINENDVVIYCDAGVNIISSLEPLLDLVNKSEEGILLFQNYQGSGYFNRTDDWDVNQHNLYVEPNKNKYWVKRDAFVLMNLDSERYWDSPQVNANFQIYRKCNSSLSFVREWLHFCTNEQVLTDAPNRCGLPDFDGLFSHIHDQAVISLLAEKYSIELFRCPSQYGNHFKMPQFRLKGEFLLLPYSSEPKNNSLYGTLTNHHRVKISPRVLRWKNFIKQELNAVINRFNYVFP